MEDRPVRTKMIKCPQCRQAAGATGRTTSDAVIAEHDSADYVMVPTVIPANGPDKEDALHLVKKMTPCRFAGTTIVDARLGLTAYARYLIDVRRTTDEAIKEAEKAAAVRPALAVVPAGFVGFLDVDEDDDDGHGSVGTDWMSLPATERPLPFRPGPTHAGIEIGAAWVDREVTWDGWECDCPSRKDHYRAPTPEPGDEPTTFDDLDLDPNGEDDDFAGATGLRYPHIPWRIVRFETYSIGYGVEDMMIYVECPTWRPVKVTEIRNPSGARRAATPEVPAEGERPIVTSAEVITSGALVTGGPAALWPAATRGVRSTWRRPGEDVEHVTIGLTGRARLDGRWWAYWDDGRFAGAFWCGWKVKVGELKDLIAGKRDEPPKPDPDAAKVRKQRGKKSAAGPRKDWVEA